MNYKSLIISKELRFKILDMFSWVPDEPWLKLLYRIKNGYWMDFKNPKTFNEKLQWLKVYGFRPEYTQMVDKYGVKEYVTKKIGAEYVIPTLGVWEKTEDINWDKLPNEFVLKTTTGGGGFGVWIVKDKDAFDRVKFAKEVYARYPNIGKPQQTHKNAFRKHPYDGVQDRIIAEEMLKVDGKVADLEYYKFYCFNGEPQYCQVIRDRSTKETIDFYDMDWKHMPFVGLNPGVCNGQIPVPCPSNNSTANFYINDNVFTETYKDYLFSGRGDSKNWKIQNNSSTPSPDRDFKKGLHVSGLSIEHNNK